MTSICAWRFSHMATDIEKLRSSTILVMLLEPVMRFTLKFTEHRFLLDVTRRLGRTFRKSHRFNRFNRILWLLFFHRTNELGERRSRDDAIELGSVVVDYADVFDHQIVDFPFLADAMEFIIDS